jgi:chlorite dismutase
MSQGTDTSSPGPTHASQHGHRPAAAGQVPATLVPESGWHFLHLFYRIDRGALSRLTEADRRQGREQLLSALVPVPGKIEQLQVFAVPGHKADFGIMLAGPDLKAIRAVQSAVEASGMGSALVRAYSFYSITEISEYVPDVEQYGKILRERENVDPDSPTYKTKLTQYANRLEGMNRQRLYPEFPDWPCVCFYPMSKMREGEQNWYLLPFDVRSELMSQHGRSGMKFAGRVTQVITASTGLEDWEWGVTLWAKNPSYLKEIVYTMRFDESSARYALFGAFYFGYLLPPAELLAEVRL